jgi:hypothetical protein
VNYALRVCVLVLVGTLAFTVSSRAQSDQLGSQGDELLDNSSIAKNPAKPRDLRDRVPAPSAPAANSPAPLPEGSFRWDQREQRCNGSSRECGQDGQRNRN